MTKPLKQIHLAAHFPGVNNTTVWSDPRSGSHIEFSSFAHLARTAERAKFDFLFLAEGLRLREQNGVIYDLDVVGRPDTFTVLAALAAVTDRLGLAGTINSTFNEPYEVARQFASLDHLSGGRAAWNVVTSWDAFTGENFRRGGFLPQDARYSRARAFLETAWELFDSWHGGEIIADKESGQFLADPRPGAFGRTDQHFDIRGQFNVPRSPQGRPVIFQAGDSDEGREFAASSADAIFSRHGTLEDGQAVLRRRQGAAGPVRAQPRRAADPARRHVRARRHRRRGGRAGPGGAAAAGQRADRDQVPGAAVEPRPVRLRPGRPAAGRRPGPRREHGLPRPGERADAPGPGGDRRAVAGEGRGREAVDPRADRRGHRPADVHRLPGHRRRSRSTPWSRRTPATGSSWCRTSPRAGSTSSPTRSCRCCRSAASSGPTTRAPRCASTWASRPLPAGAAAAQPGGVMKFLAITLIVHAPDPITGVQKSTTEPVPRGDRQRPAGRGTRLRRLRRGRAARTAVHLLVAAGRAQPHRGPDLADQAVHGGDDAEPARPGARLRGLRDARPPVGRPSRADHRQGQRRRPARAVQRHPRGPVGAQRRELRAVPADLAQPDGHRDAAVPAPAARGRGLAAAAAAADPGLARQRDQQGVRRPGGPLRRPAVLGQRHQPDRAVRRAGPLLPRALGPLRSRPGQRGRRRGHGRLLRHPQLAGRAARCTGRSSTRSARSRASSGCSRSSPTSTTSSPAAPP